MKLDIITAKEAKRNADNAVPSSIEESVNYAMDWIKYHSERGEYSCVFELDYRGNGNPTWLTGMRGKEFIAFIESLGYTYHYDNSSYYYNWKTTITISW